VQLAEPGAPLLLPLAAVLFPGGILSLRLTDPALRQRVDHCRREGQPVGVVTHRVTDAQPPFEAVGCLALVLDTDTNPSLPIRCRGIQRFEWQAARRDEQGLWQADTLSLINPDPVQTPTAEQRPGAEALGRALHNLQQRGDALPFDAPWPLDDAGWVANRWCELLPIPLRLRHELMTLSDPRIRLQLVDGFLRRHRIIG
jgi:uncharacterized protein